MNLHKKCNICLSIFLITDRFHRDNRSTDGYQSKCKLCSSKQSILWGKKNKERKRQSYSRWRLKNKESETIRNRKWKKDNPKMVSDQYKNWYRKNFIKRKADQLDYVKNKKASDPIFKFKCSIRALLAHSFKRGTNKYKKNSSTEQILGCTIDELRQHLMSKFKSGMTLTNHGQWHIDHIIPLAAAQNEEDVIRLNHYTNLQPLWAKDNFQKGGKFTVNSSGQITNEH